MENGPRNAKVTGAHESLVSLIITSYRAFNFNKSLLNTEHFLKHLSKLFQGSSVIG